MQWDEGIEGPALQIAASRYPSHQSIGRAPRPNLLG